jgi:hypothetical protein
MMVMKNPSDTSVLTISTLRNIQEDGILHNQYLKSFIALNGWDCSTGSVFPLKYELSSYIPEDAILHSHCHETLRFYIALTGWTL